MGDVFSHLMVSCTILEVSLKDYKLLYITGGVQLKERILDQATLSLDLV